MLQYIEIITFSLLGAIIRSNISNEQIIFVVICLLGYIIVFRDFNTRKNNCV